MQTTSPRRRSSKAPGTRSSIAVKDSNLREVLEFAGQRGLLDGPPTRVVRGRISLELLEEAKRRTGIESDTELLKAALANVAFVDDYWQWMHEHRGSISQDLDLEF